MKYACLPVKDTNVMLRLILVWTVGNVIPGVLGGNWWQNDGSSSVDTLKFGSSMDRDWLYNGKSVSLQLEGCIMGFNTADSEDAGCPENDSEDGTVYWYQMANCLRPQAVFSLYASDSNSASCSSSNFKESVSLKKKPVISKSLEGSSSTPPKLFRLFILTCLFCYNFLVM